MTLTDFSNLAVAAATGILAVATFVTNKRMKEQFDSMNRPYVRANLMISGSSALSLQISNEGSLPAEHLTMKLDREYFFNAEKGRSLNSAAAFSRPIKSMPGKTSWNYFLGVGHRLLDANSAPQEFNIAVKYESRGKVFEETLHVDLDALRGTGTVSTSDPSVKALESLAKSVSEISSSLKSRPCI